MKNTAPIFLSLSTLLLSSTALATTTKVGIVGAANPVLKAESPEGVTRELYVGDTVFTNDKLITSESGSAQLMFLDRSALTISPNSAVVIDEFVYDPQTELGQISMNASVGAFRFIGGALSKKNPVIIKTPVSTMGIRGGIGDTFVSEGGQTQGVFHHGDAMTMTNANGVTEVTTTPGSGFQQINANERPTPMSPQQVQVRMKQQPTVLAANVASPVTPQQLNQINQRVGTGMPPVSATPPPVPNTPVTPPTAPVKTPATQIETPAAPPVSAPVTPSAPAPSMQKPVVDNPLSDNEVQEIRRNPDSVLNKFPEGGPKMASYVTRAVGTDPTLIDDLGDALDKANPAQAAAMGAGFVRGARLVNTQNPEALGDFVDRVNNLKNPYVERTFKAIGPQVPQIGAHPLPATIPPSPPSSRNVGSDLRPDVKRTVQRSANGLRFNNPKNISAPNITPPPPLVNNVVADPSLTPSITGVAANEFIEEQNASSGTNRVTPTIRTPVISPPVIIPPVVTPPPTDDVIDKEPDDQDSPPTSPFVP